MKIKTLGWTLTACLAVATMNGFAQSAAVPGSARPQQPPAAPQPQSPATPTTAAAPAEPAFPPVNLKNFTADTPSREEVNSFLHALWGFDPNRVWSVAAILKTPAPGVAKVVVFVADKTRAGKAAQTVFFTTPDGKHAIADGVIEFGAKPFADTREVLQDQADGPARGAAGKDLLLVEFADLQCAHCKELQDGINHLVQDFPQARLVFQPFPLSEVHPLAVRAAAEGVCVRREKGDPAFFTYMQTLFDKQADLTQQGAAAALAAAATAAGADPAKAGTCADTQSAKDSVQASYDLGIKIGVDQAPMLAVNGHLLPVGNLPYETLKRIVAFQGKEDGLTVQEQPTLTNLK